MIFGRGFDSRHLHQLTEAHKLNQNPLEMAGFLPKCLCVVLFGKLVIDWVNF